MVKLMKIKSVNNSKIKKSKFEAADNLHYRHQRGILMIVLKAENLVIEGKK